MLHIWPEISKDIICTTTMTGSGNDEIMDSPTLSSRATFLGLPAELRLLIYSHIFADTCPVRTRQLSMLRYMRPFYPKSNITVVNKQIRSESLKLYQEAETAFRHNHHWAVRLDGNRIGQAGITYDKLPPSTSVRLRRLTFEYRERSTTRCLDIEAVIHSPDYAEFFLSAPGVPVRIPAGIEPGRSLRNVTENVVQTAGRMNLELCLLDQPEFLDVRNCAEAVRECLSLRVRAYETRLMRALGHERGY